MASAADRLMQHIRALVDPGPTTETDGQLLGRWADQRDGRAFAGLVGRHGALVWRVVWNVLRQREDAEDAFQATFLVLARKAATLLRHASVAGWLYQTAHRLALKARTATTRRLRREERAARKSVPQPLEELSVREARTILDEELDRLGTVYRDPLLLCLYEGATQDEAAKQLGCSLKTLKRRLERGRGLLGRRLARRGLAPATALAVTLCSRSEVPAGLAAKTIAAAGQFVSGQALTGTAVVLAEGALRGLMVKKLGVYVAAFLVLGSITLAAGIAYVRTTPNNMAKGQRLAGPEALARTEATLANASGLDNTPRVDANGDLLPAGALARLGTVRFRHTQNIADIAFSPDGKYLAAVDTDMVCLWEATTGKELRRQRATGGHGLAFAPDGNTVATAVSGAILLWDPPTGKEHRRFTEGDSPVRNLVFSPDGKTLASLTQDNTLRLSDSLTGKVLHEWPGPPNYAYSSVVFSPDSGKLALACQKDKEIPLYDSVTGKQLLRLVGHRESVHGIAFSPDGKTLASTARDDTLRFWDAATGKQLRQLKTEGGAWKLAFSPDGTILATGGWNARLWEAATGKLLRVCELDDDGHVNCLAFSPDGKTLAASRENSHALSLWDVASGKKQLAFAGHLGLVAGLAVSPDGTLLASAAWEKNYTSRNKVHLWDSATGMEVGTAGTDLGFIGGLAFAPDGRLLAAGNEDGTIRIWDRTTWGEVRRLTGHKSMVEWIGFSADGKVLASLGYHDRTIRLWSVTEGRQLQEFPGNQPHPGGGIALAPDGKTIIQGGDAMPSLVLWNATSGKAVERFGVQGGRVDALALAPDGQLMATSTLNSGVHLWNVATGKEVRWIPNPNVLASFLVFSPDGRTLALGGRDKTVRLWEVATGKERCRFVGHSGALRSGTFSPNGRTFISGSEDTTILIWDVTGRIAEGRSESNKLAAREMEDLLADLAGAEASRAHRALWILAAAPRQVVPVFRGQLRPVVAADAERVGRLMADLDSDSFPTRDNARRELQKMGEGALPALLKALASQPSLELRRRVEDLLARLTGAEHLYALRALEVLEHIGNPEARQVLETVAGGLAEAWLTGEARKSLQRLTHLPTGSP